MSTPAPIMVTAEEAAKLTGLSKSTIRDLAATGRIEKRYIGKGTRNYRIMYASLVAYADSLSIDPVTS